MLVLSDGVVILRDFIESDIEDYVRWETVETDWKLWDAPWEHAGQTDEQRAAALRDDVSWMHTYAREVASLRDGEPRRRFEVCTMGGECVSLLRSEGNESSERLLAAGRDAPAALHIGGVSTYRIDDDFSITENGRHLALGIDINSMSARGCGYGLRALRLFTEYLFGEGARELYCQTWSGNERMVHLASKLGFEECCRKPDLREVRGQRYDGLTFVLKSTFTSGD